MADDLGERTEQATPRRRQQARRSGNVAKSQDLASGLMLLAATLVVAVALMPSLGRFKIVLESVLDGDTLGDPRDPGHAITVLKYVADSGARVVGPILAIVVVVAATAHFLQVGWLFSPKALQPSLTKINPVNGFQRLFSLQSLVKAAMDSLKVIVTVAVAAITIMQYEDDILGLAYLEPLAALLRAGWMIFDLAMRLVAVLLLLALIDYIYRRWKHNEDLKMTKQQVKDEMKQTEGDPQVKQRRLRMQQQVAMQRIGAAVPSADVVVTNPEHVSVAIRYDADRMNAPVVLAKGADLVALRIRQIALLRGVPIVERPPLARALFGEVAVGQPIPPALYHAVAEVLAYVYRLRRRAG